MDELPIRVALALLAGLLALAPLRRAEGPPAALMAGWFGEAVPTGRFLLHVALFALLGLAIALALYLARLPGLAGALWEGEAARAAFFGQVLGGGAPLLLVVNFFAVVAHALSARSAKGRGRGARAALLWDAARRVAIFAAVTSLYLAGPALLRGDPSGLGGAGEALWRAGAFRDLTGVYLLAALLAPLPLIAGAAAEALRRPARQGVLAVAGALAALGLLLPLLG